MSSGHKVSILNSSHENNLLNPYLHNLEGLDLARALNVWTSAQINQGSAPIHRTLLSRYQFINIVQLIFAVREHLSKILFRNL